MEKRQLNFNAPLLSARRYSSPSNSTELRKVTEKPLPHRQQSLPVNKCSWENGDEVTKPAAVPFHWEQIPGRPKGELERQAPTPEEPSNAPRLPPARVSDAIRRNSGESPRLPPGRLSGPSRYNSGERSNDQNIYWAQVESFSYSDHASLLEKLNESLNCKDESDSESGDDVYSDALDILSLAESRSLNYSVSGLSGSQSSGVKPPGTFCVDKQTRDFMMNRFLPAAKAVVIETPQYVAKKSPSSPVFNEKPKPVRKVVSGEIKPSVKQYSANALPYYSRYTDNEESEDEDEACSVPVKKAGKVWGILPRFCVKNSLCLLNPLPGMKSKPRAPTTPAGEVRRLTRKSLSGPLDKSLQNACHMPHKKKFHSGLLSRDLPAIEDKLNNDSKQFLNARDSVKTAVSPLRRYRSGSISPYRNESPKSPFREGVGFLGVPKDVENHNASKIASSRKLFRALQDVSRNQIHDRGSSGPTGGAVEKTLYVDVVSKTKADLPISEMSVEKKALVGSRQTEDATNVKPDKDSPCPNISKERKKPSPRVGSTYKVACAPDAVEDIKLNQGLGQESRTLECISDVKHGMKDGSKEGRKLESDDSKESDLPVKSPLPPPLPKSPSESWLWRTLPSISLGNAFAHSRQRSQPQSKKQGQKGSAPDTKWETIVKISNIQHDHARYSEELTPHASLKSRQSL